MQYIRKSEARGKVDLGWLQSKHSFSFGHYYDANHMGVSVLRVINDDTVMPGRGFDTHSHRDMEIISYVTQGSLKHKDSTGNDYLVPAGDIQRMSAGRGVMHSEFNASDSEQVKFFQIWIQPNVMGVEPSYQQKYIAQSQTMTPLITPKGDGDTLSVNQDASLSRLVLQAGESISLSTADRIGYLHIVAGQLNADDESLSEGDAFALEPQQRQTITAHSKIEALWFDLPLNH
jgi:hypothetical protein